MRPRPGRDHARAARTRSCPPLAELQVKLKAPGGDPFWTHILTCTRCVQAAAALDPDVLTWPEPSRTVQNRCAATKWLAQHR